MKFVHLTLTLILATIIFMIKGGIWLIPILSIVILLVSLAAIAHGLITRKRADYLRIFQLHVVTWIVALGMTYSGHFVFGVGSNEVYEDKEIMVQSQINPWDLMSCGANYRLFEKESMLLKEISLITNGRCIKAIDSVRIENGDYHFYANNPYFEGYFIFDTKTKAVATVQTNK